MKFKINPDTYHFPNWDLTVEEVDQMFAFIIDAFDSLPFILKRILPYEQYLIWRNNIIQIISGHCYGIS